MEKNCNLGQWWNKDIYRYECKNGHVFEKDYVWNHSTCNYKIGKYLASIVDNPAIVYDEIYMIKKQKLFQQILIEKIIIL